jgi:hypothetical protein
MGSKRALTTAYHPQADGQTEILNQTLEVAIRAFTNFDWNNWNSLLTKLSFTYNNTPHTATGYTPAYLLYGFKPNVPLNYLLEPDPEEISRLQLEDLSKPESKECNKLEVVTFPTMVVRQGVLCSMPLQAQSVCWLRAFWVY